MAKAPEKAIQTFAERVRETGYAASSALQAAINLTDDKGSTKDDNDALIQAARAKRPLKDLITLRAPNIAMDEVGKPDVIIEPRRKPQTVLVHSRPFGFHPIEYKPDDGAAYLSAVASSMLVADVSTVRRLRDVLNDIRPIAEVVKKLLPRSDRSIARGKYVLTHREVDEAVSAVMGGTDPQDDFSRLVISHMLKSAFDFLKILAPARLPTAIQTQNSIVVKPIELHAVILEETLTDVLGGYRIKDYLPDAEITPARIIDALRDHSRALATALPVLTLRLRQLSDVTNLLRVALMKPDGLPEELLLDAGVNALLDQANWIWLEAGAVDLQPVSRSITDLRADVTDISQMLSRSKRVKPVAISSFVKHIGCAHVGGRHSPEKGLVLYTLLGAEPVGQMVEVRKTLSGFELAEVPSRFTQIADLRGPVATMISAQYATGLANIIADILDDEQGGHPMQPVVCTLGPSLAGSTGHSDAAVLLAIHLAAACGLRIETGGGFSVIYGADLNDAWKSRVPAATGSFAYFHDPLALIAYAMKAEDVAPIPFELGRATLPVSANEDRLIDGLAPDSFSLAPTTRLLLKVQPANRGRSEQSLTLRFMGLSSVLTDTIEKITTSTYAYAHVRERAIEEFFDVYFRFATNIAATAKGAEQGEAAVKALSWLIDILLPLVTDASVGRIAYRALVEAVNASGYDARTLQPQFKEITARAHAGAALATLYQMEFIDRATAFRASGLMPDVELTARARLSYTLYPDVVPSAFS